MSAVTGARVDDCRADTLRALAEARVRGPAAASLVARLNPAYPCEATRLALDELREQGSSNSVRTRRRRCSPRTR